MNQYTPPNSFRRWILAALIAPAWIQAQTVSPESDATKKNSETIVLSPFEVRAELDRGYGAREAMGASRVALPVGDVPVSIVSLNEQFFADRAAVDGMEVLSFVSGVQRGSDANPGQEQFTLRGFIVGAIGIRDGLPENVAAADLPFDDSSAYERLEVIKGPAGTLYGTTSMGGVVNKVSRWPRFRAETKIELQAQSYDEYVRAMVDSTGPLNDSTAYRAVISARSGERYHSTGDAPNDFFNTTLAFTHRLGNGLRGSTGRIWTRFQYLNIELDREGGIQFPTGFLDPLSPATAKTLSNPKFAVPVDANVQPENDISKANIRSYEAGYEQSFAGPLDGDWTLRLVGRYSEGRGDKSPTYTQGRPVPVNSNGQVVTYTNAAGAMVAGDNRFVAADDPRVADWRATLNLREFAGYNQGGGAFVDLVGKFSTGPIKHVLVTNAQMTISEGERAFFFWAVPNAANTTAVSNSFSLLQPDFSAVNFATVRSTAPSFNSFNGHFRAEGFAAGFQDNLSILDDRIIGVIGARYDKVYSTNYSFNSAQSIAARRFVADPSTTRTITNQDTTFKYGLVAKPTKGISLFGQVSETYIPVNTLNSAGIKFPNQEGEIKEVGVKIALLDNRLIATASAFDMELKNAIIQVNNPPELGGGTVAAPAGKQTSKGYEIDLSYEILPGWNAAVAYSDLTSKNELNQYFRGVPITATYSVLTKYEFRSGTLRGLFLGSSLKHVGKSAGDATNTFFLDNANVVDAFVGFGYKRWGIQLNVANLLDTDDQLSAVSDTLVLRALPRNYRLTLRYRF